METARNCDRASVTLVKSHICEYLKYLVRCQTALNNESGTKRNGCSIQFVEECSRNSSDLVTTDVLLTEIQQFLETQTSVKEALKMVPETGQVLGRLCAIPVVTGNPVLYGKLMRCTFALYRQRPATPVEAKAREWALNQLKSTTACSQYRAWPNHHLYSTTWAVQEKKLKQNVSAIVKLIGREACCCHGAGEVVECLGRRERCPRRGGCSPQHLRRIKQVAHTLLLSLHQPEFWPAWVAILRCLACHPLEEGTVEIYQQLSEHSAKLPFSVRVLLWKSFLPALETSVLDVVQSVMNAAPLPTVMRDVISRSLLPQACAGDGSLHAAVCGMLHSILQGSGGSSMVGDILTEFSRCMHEEVQSAASSHQLLSVPLPVPCPQLQSLGILLQASPSDFSPQAAEEHLMRICDMVCSLEQKGGSDARLRESLLLLLLHHRAWYHLALWLMLCGPPQRLKMLTWFVAEHFHETNETEFMSCFLATVERLRRLATEAEVLPAAIEACLAPMKGSTVENHPALHQTLLALLLQSPAPSRIASHILTRSTSSRECWRHLAALLRAYQVFGLAREHWSPPSRADHCRVLRSLMSEVGRLTGEAGGQQRPQTQQLCQEADKVLQLLTADL